MKHVPGPRPTLPRKRRRKAVGRPIRSTARLLTVAGFGERSSLRRLELSNEDDRRIRRALNDAGAGGGDTFIGDRRTVKDYRGASVVFTPDAALSLRPSEHVTAGAIDVWMAMVVNRAGPGWRAMSSCFYDRLLGSKRKTTRRAMHGCRDGRLRWLLLSVHRRSCVWASRCVSLCAVRWTALGIRFPHRPPSGIVESRGFVSRLGARFWHLWSRRRCCGTRFLGCACRSPSMRM